MMRIHSQVASLEGRVVVVTGGASGIGLAAAVAALSAGAAVMVADRSRSALDAAAALLGKFDRPWVKFEVDVTDAGDVQRLVEATFENFGRVDGLVTSAGIERSTPSLQLTEDEFDEVVRVNLKGSFLAAQAFGRAMVEIRCAGAIVTVGSALAFSGRENGVPYAVSKGGVVALTKSLALEWGRYGIRVNSVAPGVIDTPLAERLPEAFREAYVKRTPLGRIGSADDVGRVVRFLLSEDAGYVTGQTIVVNGGFLMPS